jgi:beta-mannosidase
MSYLNFLIFLSFCSFCQNSCQPYETLNLNNGWVLKNGPRNIDIPNLNVPFSVHSALRREKRIPDPLYRYNDVELRWIAKDNSWTISNMFRIDRSDWLTNSQINLEFYSIDTVAKVYLNDQLILVSNNEFLKYVVENINSKLKQGDNMLRIDFTSAINYAKNLADNYPYRVPVVCPPEVQRGECHVNKIRKQQCSFSWDWGPGVQENLTLWWQVADD